MAVTGTSSPTPARTVAAVALVAAALALLTSAPLFIPASYDWLTNTTSESAAQGIKGAWIARLGFVVFAVGVAVIVQTVPWPRTARIVHELFAFGLVGTAAFPTRPWFDVAYNHTDDRLHSIAATLVGISFVAGTALVARWEQTSRHWIDAGASVTATTLAVLMSTVPAVDGMLQRALFLLAAAWYLGEVLAPRPDR
jgi:TRAP-type C4-dicarboxylate transport system permease small subunit